jgi:hypothetical protein
LHDALVELFTDVKTMADAALLQMSVRMGDGDRDSDGSGKGSGESSGGGGPRAGFGDDNFLLSDVSSNEQDTLRPGARFTLASQSVTRSSRSSSC